MTNPDDRDSRTAISTAVEKVKEIAKRQKRNAFLIRAMLIFLRAISVVFFPLLAIYLLLAGVVGPGLLSNAPNYVYLIVLALIYSSFFIFPFLLSLPVVLPLAYRNKNMDRITIFRKFHDFHSEAAIRKIVRSSLGLYGHVFTLSDSRIKVEWSVKVPILLGQMGFFAFRQRKIKQEKHVRQLERSLQRKGWLNVNWLVSTSKIFAIQTADLFWKTTAQLLLTESRLVLIDISHVTDAMEWELATVKDLGLQQNVILIASQKKEIEAMQWRRQLSAEAQCDIPLFLFDGKGNLPDQTAFADNVSQILAQYRSGQSTQFEDRLLPKVLLTSGVFLLIYLFALFLMGPSLSPQLSGKYSPFPQQVLQAYIQSFWKENNRSYIGQIRERAKARWPKRMAEGAIAYAFDHHLSEHKGVCAALLDFADHSLYDRYLQLVEQGEAEISDAAFDILEKTPEGIPTTIALRWLADSRIGIKDKGLRSLWKKDKNAMLLDTIITLMIPHEQLLIPGPDKHESEPLLTELLGAGETFDGKRVKWSYQFFRFLATNDSLLDTRSLRTFFQRAESPELRTIFALLLALRHDASGFSAVFDPAIGDFYYTELHISPQDSVYLDYHLPFQPLIDTLFGAERAYEQLPDFDALAAAISPAADSLTVPSSLLHFFIRHYAPHDLSRFGWRIDGEILTQELYDVMQKTSPKDREPYIQLIRINRSRIESVMGEEIRKEDEGKLVFSRLMSVERIKIEQKLKAAWLLAHLGAIETAEIAVLAGNFSKNLLWHTYYPYEVQAFEILKVLYVHADTPFDTQTLEKLREGLRPEMSGLLKKLIDKY